MKRVQSIDTSEVQERKGERGAALVTTLLVSMLLLTAGGALILTTSLSATNAVDSNAEAQAYYAAEAGLQESLNVLRGNSSITNPAFTFATAGDKASGNKSGDSTTYSRLSNWLPYGNTSAYQDRVTLTQNYSPLNGLAFSVQVTAPDPENIPVGNNGNKIDNFSKSSLPPGATPEATPSWHQWHCGHCSWQYSHHNSCTHKHCTNPNGTGRATVDDTRLLVQATGYGPKGAIKNMEMIVKRTVFDYNEAAAAITMVGPPDNSAPITMNITQDSDNHFTGDDLLSTSTTVISAFGFTSSGAQSAADAYILTLHSGGKPVQAPKTVLMDSTTTPPWLASADDTRTFLAELQSIAVSMGRYYTTSNQPAAGTYGTDGAPVFTFVDGNFTVPGGKKGGGLLVVTGTLEIQKDAEWDGLILVLGDDPSGNASKFKLTTDGHAKIYGALVIAPFHRVGTSPIPFLGPVFDTSLGGHDAEFKYDSGEVRDAIYTIPPKVVGVHEGFVTVPTS
jgi:hypothetical protein